MAKEKGVKIDEVAAKGPGLVFVVYPEGLTKMPVSPVWSILFFFMMLNLGFSSEFSMIECVLSAFIDEYPELRKGKRETLFRVGACTFFFGAGIIFVTNVSGINFELSILLI